jgi:iron complex transport system ATP-binding protein
MQDGRVAADGPPNAVLTAAALGQVFAIRAHFEQLPDGPLVVPVARLAEHRP